MATGPEHYAVAEQCLARLPSLEYGTTEAQEQLLEAIARGLLANAAATALSENGSMPGVDFDAWAKVASAEPSPSSRLTVWWLDDGEENPGKPPLYTSEAAARDGAIEQYCQANPFSDPDSDEVSWRAPEDADDAAEAAELSVKGRRTGIFVRPVQPKAGA